MQEQESGPDRVADRDGYETVTETGFVETNGVETYYERRGEGPPVVFIHGTLMSTTAWDVQAEALSDEYTTTAYDVRGHGRTGGSDVQSYSFDLYAEDLHALLAALHVRKPVLVGLSGGGCIAQVYAARHPENVAGLVLSDTFTTGPLSLPGRLLFANLRFFGLLDNLVRYTTLNRLQLRVANRLAPGSGGDGVTTQRLIEDAPAIPHREFVKIIDAMASFPTSDFDGSDITVPALVLYGEHTPRTFRAMHARVPEGLPNATVEVRVVPGGGHASNVDNPAFFTGAVRSFLERVHGGE
jgi:pimeloyl-ACP methyl ester carboxylesterase